MDRQTNRQIDRYEYWVTKGVHCPWGEPAALTL